MSMNVSPVTPQATGKSSIGPVGKGALIGGGISAISNAVYFNRNVEYTRASMQFVLDTAAEATGKAAQKFTKSNATRAVLTSAGLGVLITAGIGAIIGKIVKNSKEKKMLMEKVASMPTAQ